MCQLTGSGLGTWAISQESLPFLYAGCFFIGLGQGLGQFYRFSAVELSPARLKDRAVTYVLTGKAAANVPLLLEFHTHIHIPTHRHSNRPRHCTPALAGGIIAAFLGPTSATYSKNIFGAKYQGSYAIIAFFAVMNELVLLFVRFPPSPMALAKLAAEGGESDRLKTQVSGKWGPVADTSGESRVTARTIERDARVALRANASLKLDHATLRHLT